MKQPKLPELPFTSAEAHELGVGDAVLRRLVRDGILVRIRPDLYWLVAAQERLEVGRRHMELALATMRQLQGEFVLSHESAAMLHGLPTPRRLVDGPTRVRLYTVDTRNSAIRQGIHIAVSPLFPGDVVVVSGIRVTSVARTAIDLARGLALPAALIALDGAMRQNSSHEALMDVALNLKQWRGTKTLRSSIAYASGQSESALESAARGTCIAAGLPVPELQVQIAGASGRTYRVDMLWREHRLILEPDGWSKYGVTAPEQRHNFKSEKTREDDLRAAGYRVLRVTWEGLPALSALVSEKLRSN